MDAARAKEIYDSPNNYAVQLDGEHSVWIENVDVANGMATVQVGTNPADTETVSVDRLKEERH